MHLVMLSYEIDPALLEPLVPVGTELDSFGGKTFVSVVAFQFLDTRVTGLAVPFHRNFDEINLRFYVRRHEQSEVRRGVVFIQEIVPRRAIALIARALYNENYVALPMSHDDEIGRVEEPRVAYSWQHEGRAYRVEARVRGAPYLPDESSLEAFITEHYWGYVKQRNGDTLEYQVEHPRWRVWRAHAARLDGGPSSTYGSVFASALAGTPSSAFVAEGSAVVVRRGRRLAQG
jgi:uncharacterized protein